MEMTKTMTLMMTNDNDNDDSNDIYESTVSSGIQYVCQVSRLRVESFDLTPTHARGPISHA